jgi:hypothetical protein
LALPADDPARLKYAELKSRGASREEILAAMDTYEVLVTILVRGLSPLHAKAIVSELENHMIETHLDAGMAAVSTISDATKQAWLDGPLFGGELNG